MNQFVDKKPVNYQHRVSEDTLVKNRYYVLKKLGDGCYAKVFLVQDIKTEEVYALKAIRKIHFKSNSKLRYMLDKEAKIHRSSIHPNIVRLYDYFEDKDYVFFLLEYCYPGELFDILYDETDHGFDEYIAADFVYQVVQAFIYLRSKNVIHRDLKPENLLINEEGNLKLADFGWATFKKGSSVVGSTHYNSPEMLRYKMYDYKSDIWSIGVLIYELVCGDQPFRGKGKSSKEKEKATERLIKQCRIKRSKYTESISDEAMDLILQILQLDPSRRPDYEDILNHPWMVNYGPREDGTLRVKRKRLVRARARTTSKGYLGHSRSRSIERSLERTENEEEESDDEESNEDSSSSDEEEST